MNATMPPLKFHVVLNRGFEIVEKSIPLDLSCADLNLAEVVRRAAMGQENLDSMTDAQREVFVEIITDAFCITAMKHAQPPRNEAVVLDFAEAVKERC